MSTTELAPPNGVIPRFKLGVFNTLYSPEDSVVEPVPVSDEHGWLMLDDTDVWLLDLTIDEKTRKNTVGTMTVADNDAWLFGIDIVYKTRAVDVSYTNVVPDRVLAASSKLAIRVIEIDGGDLTGTVSINGTVDGEVLDSPIIVSINGSGTYITDTEFDSISSVTCDTTVGNAVVTIWGNVGTYAGRRECRIWCDCNDDGVYGLVHGGYVERVNVSPGYGFRNNVFKLYGYRLFAQSNEYVCGSRAEFRCSNYSKTGISGSCIVNDNPLAKFRDGGNTCYVGEYDTRHPDGTSVDDDHRCTLYAPGWRVTEHIPYDGWTYDKYYCPDTDPKYEPVPKNYMRALTAACNMLNSLERGRKVSREWDQHCVFNAELLESMTDSGGAVIGWVTEVVDDYVTENSYALIDDEVVKVIDLTPFEVTKTTVGLMRGMYNTAATSHTAGTPIRFLTSGKSPDGTNFNVLARNGQLQTPNLKNTVADTTDSLAKNATSEIIDSEYVIWYDKYKQLNMTEMALPSTGSTGTGGSATLTLTENDFVENPTVSIGSVVNEVSCRVNIENGHWLYASLKAEDAGLIGYDKSVATFGRILKEESNTQLNSYAPVDGHVDFITWATNYLKLRAFPVLTQTVCVMNFVPDEHWWYIVEQPPYLNYTDTPNEHIDIRGTKVSCPDYWLPKADGDYQLSTFVVEGVKTAFTPPGDYKVYLTLSRHTGPEDF